MRSHDTPALRKSEGALELRHCLQGLLRWHPACTARAWGSKRFFTFGALPPDWLSAPRCDSTGCSGVFFGNSSQPSAFSIQLQLSRLPTAESRLLTADRSLLH